MRDPKVEGAKWAELHKNSVFADQAARKARIEVIGKFAACAKRTGPEPTLAELEEATRLEKAADEARLLEVEFLRDLFGVLGG